MKKLRTALSGLGRIGWKYHLPEIVKHEGFEIVGVVDPLRERLAEAKEKFSVTGFENCKSLFKSVKKIDLLVIASPTPFHLEQSLTAFDNNCDVFCDKPMAVSYEEARQISGAMKSAGRKFMVYQPHRANEFAVSLKQILSSDIIGSTYMIKRSISGFNRRNDWQSQKKYGGGMLNNYGAHFIDQLLYLAGSSAKKVFCITRNIVSIGDAEDFVKIIIETGSGIILDIEINMASTQPLNPWYIGGNRGSVILDIEREAWSVRYGGKENFAKLQLQENMAAVNRSYGNGEDITWIEKSFPVRDFQPVDFYRKCFEYFALNNPPFIPIEETLEVMRVIDLCRKT